MPATTKGTRFCPQCRGQGLPTVWRPGAGFDPCMRQFRCTRCNCEFYIIADTPEAVSDIDRQALELEAMEELTRRDPRKAPRVLRGRGVATSPGRRSRARPGTGQ